MAPNNYWIRGQILSWGVAAVVFLLITIAWLTFGTNQKMTLTHYREYLMGVLPTDRNSLQPPKRKFKFANAAVVTGPAVVTICAMGRGIHGRGTHLEGIGSGTIINAHGVIVTSAQIIGNRKDLKVAIFPRLLTMGPPVMCLEPLQVISISPMTW